MQISHGKPAIENSDRGFTIDKKLGWSVLVAITVGIASIVGMLLTLNTTLNRLDSRQTALDAQHQVAAGRQLEDREDIRRNAREIIALQTTNAAINQQLINIERTSKETAEAMQQLRADMARFFGQRPTP